MSAGVSDQRRKGPGHQGGYTQNGDNNKYGMSSSSNNGSGYHGGNNYQNSSNNVSWANQVNRSNDGYQHHAPPRPINSNRSGDDLRDLDQGVKGLSFNNGQQGDRKKSDGGGASKKMTWATVASQPAKPQVTTTSLLVKKKGKGMPPPPMVPGKHNLDIGSWDTAVRDPTPPPSPPTPPPVEPTPIPLNAQHQQAIEREEQQLKQQQQRNQHQNGQGGGHYDGGRRDHHNYQQNNRDGYNNNNGYNNYREKRSWNNNQGPPQQNYHERPNGGAPGGGGAGNNRPMQQNYNNGGGYAGGGGGRGNYHGGQHRDHNGYNNQPRSVSPTQQQQQPQQYHRREAPHSPVQQHHRDHGLEDREQLSPGRHEEPPQHHQHYGGRSAKVSVSDTEEPELTREMIDKLMDKNNYNPPQLQLERGKNARFFVIKSYSEDDIHRSIKYEIWCSTEHGNKRLDQAYREREQEGGNVLLFFSVNGSGHFCGIAEMISAVDYNSKSTVWAQDKWRGVFKVKWIYVKDVPNQMLRQIRLENNENKPVTNSRDTQEVPNPQGLQMLEIIHGFQHTTSIFDDFVHYEKRQEEEDSRKHVVEPRGDSQRGHYGGQRDYQGGRGGGYNNGDRPQYNHRGGYGSDNNYNRRPGGEGRGFGGHRDNYEGGGERGGYNNHRDRDNYDNYQPRSFGPPRDDRDNNYRRDYRDNNNYRGGRGGGGNMNGNNNNRGGGRWNTGRDME